MDVSNGHLTGTFSQTGSTSNPQNFGTLLAGSTYRLYKSSGSYTFDLKAISFTPCTNTVSAYTISNNEVIGAGNVVNDIAGIAMTFGSSTESTWTKSSYSGWGLDDKCTYTLTGKIPTAGTFVKVKPSEAGRLTVQWYTRNGGGSLNLTDGTSTEAIAANVDGAGSGIRTVVFSTILDPSKTYYVYISGYSGSIKIGFVSFQYVHNTSIIAVDNLGYTFSSTLPLDFTGTDIEAYTAEYNGTTKKVTLNRVYKVPANTGLFIKGTPDDIPVLTGDADDMGTNNLKAVSAATNVAATDGDNTNYVLALADKNDESKGVVFLKASGAEITAGKAYLQIPTASAPSEARMSVVFADDETTGIADARGKMSDVKGEYYNLSGQRVEKPGKGLYIKNGKKIIVK